MNKSLLPCDTTQNTYIYLPDRSCGSCIGLRTSAQREPLTTISLWTIDSMHNATFLPSFCLLVWMYAEVNGVSLGISPPIPKLAASNVVGCEQNNKQICVCRGTPNRVCDRGTELRTLQIGLLDRYMEEFPKSTFCSCDASPTENSTEFFMNIVFVSKVPWEEAELLARWDAIEVLVEHTRISLPVTETSTCENHIVIVALMEEQLIYIANRTGDCQMLPNDELQDILKINRTEYITPSEFCSGLTSLIHIMNGTLSDESLGRKSAYWITVSLILVFILCWVAYTQISFWCIQRRDHKTSWEYWTSTYVCLSTVTGLTAFGVVLYYLIVSPLLFEENCEDSEFSTIIDTNW